MTSIHRASLLSLLAIAGLALGCSADDLSCDFTVANVHSCLEFADLSGDQPTAAESVCTGFSGKQVDACPTENQLGTCALKSNDLGYSQIFYSDNSVTPEAAEAACTSANGTWTAK